MRELREAEERKRQELAKKPGGSKEAEGVDPRHVEKPSAPPSGELEQPSFRQPTPHSFLPDTDRDGFELPSGVTLQEAMELHLHGSPVGISFEYQGKSTTAIGDQYSAAINTYLDIEKPRSNSKAEGLNPDGAMLLEQGRETVVVESKCIEDWSKSVYNPNYQIPFKHEAAEDVVDQSLKYARKYDRVDWYTNSLDFVRVYAKKFKAAGIENFTFTVIPAVRAKS